MTNLKIWRIRLFTLLLTCVTWHFPCADVLAQQSPKIFPLDLEVNDPSIKGKSAAVGGEADAKGHRFELQQLTIRKPVLVAVRATDSKQRLQLQLLKFSWDIPEKSAVTDPNGLASFLVKTEGDMRILVKAERGTAPYSMLVLVGDEVMTPVPSIFVPMRKRDMNEPHMANGLTAAAAVTWIAVLLPLVVVGISYDRHRQRGGRGRECVILLAVLTSSSSLLAAGSDPLPIRFMDWMGKFIAQGNFEKIYDTGVKALEARNKVDPLTKQDASKDENYNPPGAPQVPSSCVTAPLFITNCNECYQSATGRLNRVRTQFERLRALYQENQEYVQAQIAFGESVASIPNAGLGWYEARKKIEEGEQVFYQAYDKKYSELTQSLEQSLKSISECEDKYFNEKNWYDRFGFIYYQFMADRYKRK
jgi:hypothetical protein